MIFESERRGTDVYLVFHVHAHFVCLLQVPLASVGPFMQSEVLMRIGDAKSLQRALKLTEEQVGKGVGGSFNLMLVCGL